MTNNNQFVCQNNPEHIFEKATDDFWCPTCPSVPVSWSSRSSQTHPAHVSPLSGRAAPVSGRLSGATAGGAITTPRLPDAFRPPAFASWAIPLPLRMSAFLTVGLPVQNRSPDPNGVTTFHSRETRPGKVPPQPRERRCSCTPVLLPITRGSF